MDFQEPVPGIPGAVFRRVASLAPHLADSVGAGQFVQAKPGHLLLVMPGTGNFLARDGSIIEFSVEAEADEGAVVLYLNGTARGALIHQRGELPLHACTLVPPGGDTALAICGHSGAGKSTLGAELSRRGWTLVADDTTRITWDGEGPLAWPSRDSIKLWKDACEAAALDVSTLERVMKSIDKFYVRVAARDKPIRLGTIAELTGEETGRMLSTGEKMALVTRNTYRPSQIMPLGVQKAHVRIVAQTAAACRVIRLPGERALTTKALADRIEATLR